jgi:hypothetical protein
LHGHSIEPNDGVTTESINISQERMTLGSHETMNDNDSEKNDGVEMEPDAVSLSPLPKDKILLGPFVPLPLDDCGRLIHEGSNQKRKSQESVLNVNNQVRNLKGFHKIISAWRLQHTRTRCCCRTPQNFIVFTPLK